MCMRVSIMNELEIKEMFREECCDLEKKIETIEDDIELSQIELIRIERFMDLLNKLPGSSLIGNMDKDDLYYVRNYYINFLKNIAAILTGKKEDSEKLCDQLDKLFEIQKCI